MTPSHSLSQDLVASGLIADRFLRIRRSALAPSSRQRAARLSRVLGSAAYSEVPPEVRHGSQARDRCELGTRRVLQVRVRASRIGHSPISSPRHCEVSSLRTRSRRFKSFTRCRISAMCCSVMVLTLAHVMRRPLLSPRSSRTWSSEKPSWRERRMNTRRCVCSLA